MKCKHQGFRRICCATTRSLHTHHIVRLDELVRQRIVPGEKHIILVLVEMSINWFKHISLCHSFGWWIVVVICGVASCEAVLVLVIFYIYIYLCIYIYIYMFFQTIYRIAWMHFHWFVCEYVFGNKKHLQNSKTILNYKNEIFHFRQYMEKLLWIISPGGNYAKNDFPRVSQGWKSTKKYFPRVSQGWK